MSTSLYFNIRLILAGMLFVLGACLFCGNIPSKLRGTIFDSSRKCLGLAITVMPLSTFLVYFLSLRLHGCNLHVVSYLTACYVISILVTVGFVPLLGGKMDYRSWRFIRGLISIPFFAMPMSLAGIYGNAQIVEIAKVVTVLMLLATITYQSYIFCTHYSEAVRRGNNYYSDDIEVDINWIVKSVVAFFIMEMVCAISTFFRGMSVTAEFVLTIYRVATIVFVFFQFMKFMRHYETMIDVCKCNEAEEEAHFAEVEAFKYLTEEQRAVLSVRLEGWIKKQGFTESGVTISDVAAEAATNRTYLSEYINATYRCSFKVWVTSLRVERAKELLVGEDTIVDISRQVGFSSSQSFTHSFKRSEGVTPTEWRDNYKKIFKN